MNHIDVAQEDHIRLAKHDVETVYAGSPMRNRYSPITSSQAIGKYGSDIRGI